MKRYLAAVVATLLCSGQAIAGSHTGTIKTLYINLQTATAHVKFNEAVTFTGGTTCSNVFTGNSVDDDRFMNLVWPLLIMAKSRNLPVTILTEACLTSYPTIHAVDVEAR
jgi:hypothetical protein